MNPLLDEPVRVSRTIDGGSSHAGTLVKFRDNIVAVFGCDRSSYDRLIKGSESVEVPVDAYPDIGTAVRAGWVIGDA